MTETKGCDGNCYEERIISEKKGRGLVAKKDIRKGSVILVEKPLVGAQFLWNKHCGYSACDHCLASLESARDNLRRLTKDTQLSLPHPEFDAVNERNHMACPHCPLRYCSSTCRDEAWNRYHQLLCLGPRHDDELHPSNVLDELWKNSHFPPETASIHLISRILAMIRLDPETKKSIAVFSCGAKSDDGRLVHKLFGDHFESRREEIRLALSNLLPFEEVAEFVTPAGFGSLLSLIGSNSQGVGTNSFTAWYRKFEEASTLTEDEKTAVESFVDEIYEKIEIVTGTDFMNNEGAALYRLQSACNHSCDPNAEVSFPRNDDSLTLTALRDIEDGEEICISYLEECQRKRSRHSRQKHLKENYVFECRCRKCEDEIDEPDVTSEEEEEEEDQMES